MNSSSKDTGSITRGPWNKGVRAKVSIMHVFRAAHIDRDAKIDREKSKDGEAVVTQRSKQRRHGVSEDTLRAHIQYDLQALLNTIRLDAVIPLEDAPHIARSVLNYGFRDLSNVTSDELSSPRIVDSIRQSLIDHEPRLIRDTIEVKMGAGEGDSKQRLSITVSAELMGDPVDIPIDFSADVDLGAGKMKMSQLRLQT